MAAIKKTAVADRNPVESNSFTVLDVYKPIEAGESGMTKHQLAIVEDDENAKHYALVTLSDPTYDSSVMEFKDKSTEKSVIILNGEEIYPIYPGGTVGGETFYFVEAVEGAPISDNYDLFVQVEARAPDKSKHLGIVKKVVNIVPLGRWVYYNVGTADAPELLSNERKIYVRVNIGEEGALVAADDGDAKLPAAEDLMVESAIADAQVSFVHKICTF